MDRTIIKTSRKAGALSKLPGLLQLPLPQEENPPDSELLRVIHRVMILSEKQITKPVLIDALSKKAKKHVLDILLERHGSWIKVRQLVGIIKKNHPNLSDT